MKSFLKSVIPALLILLFTYATVSKLIEAERFRNQLYLQPFPHWLADILVYALPATEILAALLLCFERSRRAGLLISSILMAAFTGYISFLLIGYQGKQPCSCGGILNHMSWTTHLVFNWAFLICAITGILLYRDRTIATT